jgi:DNA repair protein RadC
MKIKDIPQAERPREKLLHWGAESLSDSELLAILLRTGRRGKSALQLAQELLTHFGGLRRLLSADQAAFCEISGIGVNKYLQCKAAQELSRRSTQAQLREYDVLKRTQVTKQYLASSLGHHQQEVFACLFLDTQLRLLHFEKLFFGTIDYTTVHPRIIVKKALQYNAAAVILAHNHPSGKSEPSPADIEITETLDEALALVDIRLVDHIIVGEKEPFSFVENGFW